MDSDEIREISNKIQEAEKLIQQLKKELRAAKIQKLAQPDPSIERVETDEKLWNKLGKKKEVDLRCYLFSASTISYWWTFVFDDQHMLREIIAKDDQSYYRCLPMDANEFQYCWFVRLVPNDKEDLFERILLYFDSKNFLGKEYETKYETIASAFFCSSLKFDEIPSYENFGSRLAMSWYRKRFSN